MRVQVSSVETRKFLVVDEAFEVGSQIVVCSASVGFEFLVKVHVFKVGSRILCWIDMGWLVCLEFRFHWFVHFGGEKK